jgi:hypothetical protein
MSPRAVRQSTPREVGRGLLWIALLVISVVPVFFFDTILRATQEGPRLTVAATSAAGLVPGSTVWVAGQPVGRVLSVRFRPPDPVSRDNVIIETVLQRSIGDVIRADATVSIHPSDLLEPVVVSVRPGRPTSPPFEFSDTLRATSDDLDQEYVLSLFNSLQTEGQRLKSQARELATALENTDGTLGALSTDEALRAAYRRDLTRLRNLLVRDLESGALGLLMTDSLLPASLDSVRARLAVLQAGPQREPGAEEPDYVALASRLDALKERISSLDAMLNAGEGTVGRALHDREIQRQVSALRARLDSVVVELMGQPERWLRVRIF